MSKMFVFFFCVFVAVGSVAAFAVTTNVPGDVNGDGAISIVDALLVAQYYVGLQIPAIDLEAADVNCSQTVTIIDALMIAQYYVGLITGFPCGTVPTPGSTGQYILHVKLHVYSSGSPSVQINYTGDYIGSGIIPFDIGPYPNPFTVTLTAPQYAFYMGVQPFLFYRWEDMDSNHLPSGGTVTVNDENPELTIVAAYRDESYILTSPPTPPATPDPIIEPTPDLTPEYTPVPNAGYVIHVSAIGDRYRLAAPLNVSISVSGDDIVTHNSKTPFDIGPYSAPFTVSLSCVDTVWYSVFDSGEGPKSHMWVYEEILVDKIAMNPYDSVSITADDAKTERTVVFAYRDYWGTPTINPTPNPTP